MNKLTEFITRIDIIKITLSLTALACLQLIVYALVYKEIPEGNRDILVHTLGLIEGMILSMINFYWGSSQGSKDKSSVIDKAMDDKTVIIEKAMDKKEEG